MRTFSVDLWDGVEGALADDAEPRARLDAYVLDGEKRRGAVLVIPGGGYVRVAPREAEPVALRFAATGRHAFVLSYSVAPRRHPQPLLDAARAMRILRDNAAAWSIAPDRIAVCGFSAGAHLASCLAGLAGEVSGAVGIGSADIRPNALILAYPVASSGEFAHRGSFESLLGPGAQAQLRESLSMERRVDASWPPVFLWHTADDASVPLENSLLLATALRKARVPLELHVYPRGAHGLSLATPEVEEMGKPADPRVAGWAGLCVEWLEGELPEKKS